MGDNSNAENNVNYVASFEELVETPFQGQTNALCWLRNLKGNFEEIVLKVELTENMATLDQDMLLRMDLSAEGQLARNILLQDLNLLQNLGASPIINVIHHYEKDEEPIVFPTDVYSFHVDSSPIPFDTFLCTYYGASSQIIANNKATQKVLIPAVRTELLTLYGKNDTGFEDFLIENCFDLHYQADEHAEPLDLAIGHLWRLAIQHPESKVPPCIHRAPIEKAGQKRLLLIC